MDISEVLESSNDSSLRLKSSLGTLSSSDISGFLDLNFLTCCDVCSSDSEPLEDLNFGLEVENLVGFFEDSFEIFFVDFCWVYCCSSSSCPEDSSSELCFSVVVPNVTTFFFVLSLPMESLVDEVLIALFFERGT